MQPVHRVLSVEQVISFQNVALTLHGAVSTGGLRLSSILFVWELVQFVCLDIDRSRCPITYQSPCLARLLFDDPRRGFGRSELSRPAI